MEYRSDFLIIGSGIAGLSFALKASRLGSVHIVTKKEKAESNTNYAQGGIAAVLGPPDTYSQHVEDTEAAGAGLCHREVVETVVREGPERVRELMAWGVQFTRRGEELELGREGGHRRHRIVHAKDLTGREIERALIEALRDNPAVKIFENHLAIDLLSEHQLGRSPGRRGRIHCYGAYVLDAETNDIHTFLAPVVVLCTGGCGHVYLHTTNPAIATGDGVAMSYRAGASLANLEFMQFHPTTLFHENADSFLITEAVRGAGAILKNRAGVAFMQNYHPMKDLAPRDIVARAIDTEMKKSGEACVYLDMTHLDASMLQDRFPNIYERCMSFKIDITRELAPVVPAAHYICGGVLTDLWGRTSIAGLYACGEVACTGLHGANRLASNSLLEAVVFAHRAFVNAEQYLRERGRKILPKFPEWNAEGTYNQEEWVFVAHDRKEVQSLMWDYVGIVRSTVRLHRAQRRLMLINREIEDFYKRTRVTEGLVELRNLATVALLIVRCALRRKESRGLHYTTDYPEIDDRHWRKDTIFKNPRIGKKHHSLKHSLR
jgi:L-aspartate oxidase